jgi:hypothetical protein
LPRRRGEPLFFWFIATAQPADAKEIEQAKKRLAALEK